ncbi:MAG: efflux RND transporter permease subunit [candidate division Zixibacteria bacterium]|nr:efflux RND transporter permease subunit [candidate division Zixibacteria bacterium]
MYLANTSIKRPVFTVMIMAAMAVLGLSSYLQMSTELFPDVDFPFVIVQTVYPGASPDAVETDVTKRIEDQVNTIAGIKRLTSFSRESLSLVLIEFELETNADIAAQDVRDKVSGIMADLPADIEQPVIQKFDFAGRPVITFSISADRSLKELTGFAKNFLKRRLETVSGVGSIEIIGGSEREIQALLDLDKINARGIVPYDISDAISSSNMEIPGGKLNQGRSDLAVRIMGRASSIEELSQIIVKNENGQVIRLGDIAEVVDGIKERKSLSRYNGKETVSLALLRQSGANIVDVADGIIARMDELKSEIPADIDVILTRDESTFIKESIHHVVFDLIYGSCLAVLVIFLFLANLRSTIISGLAIPTSIIGTFFLMKLFGFTINFMTLLGLSLAVGLLIDDAIVVIENIYRHLDEGSSPWKAAREATAQIGLAVMAATFTIVVVFLPVAFMSGIIGRFFYQFGITVAGSVTISLLVAFTLTPMLSSRFLKKETQIGSSKPGLINLPGNILKAILRGWNSFFNNLNGRYRGVLAWVLKHRLATLMIAVAMFFGSLFVGSLLGSEFMPTSDRSEFYALFKAGPDASLERTGDLALKIEEKMKQYPEVEFLLTKVGGEQTPPNEGEVYIKLKPIDQREKSADQLLTQARKDLAEIAGLTIQLLVEPGDGGGEQQVEFSVRGPDFEVVKSLANQVEEIMREAPGGIDFENSEKVARPEMQVYVDRDLASDLGVSVGGLAMTVRNLVDGYVVSRFKDKDEEYDIRVQLAPEFRNKLNDIERFKLTSDKKVRGEDLLVELGSVATLTTASAPTEIRRYNRQKDIKVGCNLREGYVMSDITNHVYSRLPDLNVPPGYEIAVVGMAEFMEESFRNILMALVLSIIFIYLLLASQFESFIDPLAIMLSLPLAVVGALITLYVWNSTLNVMSLIGVVMLMGLVTKNAILLIDFTKQLRREGLSRTQALLKAGPIRLRPILMTTFATIFGMLPIALALGTGTEFKSPMARAVIGGLISSTLLTLVVVPVVYTILDDIVAFFMGRETVKVEAESAGGLEPAGLNPDD